MTPHPSKQHHQFKSELFSLDQYPFAQYPFMFNSHHLLPFQSWRQSQSTKKSYHSRGKNTDLLNINLRLVVSMKLKLLRFTLHLYLDFDLHLKWAIFWPLLLLYLPVLLSLFKLVVPGSNLRMRTFLFAGASSAIRYTGYATETGLSTQNGSSTGSNLLWIDSDTYVSIGKTPNFCFWFWRFLTSTQIYYRSDFSNTTPTAIDLTYF